MKDELNVPTPREKSGSLEAGLFAGPAADDNSFEARRPSTQNDEEGAIENTTEISDAVVDEDADDEDEDEEVDDDEDEDDDEDVEEVPATEEDNEDDDDDEKEEE